MRVAEAKLYALRIPFVEEFRHSTQARTFSDSIVVELRATDGTVGYGEGVARPYVTGETVERCLSVMNHHLWPRVASHDFREMVPDRDPLVSLAPIQECLGDEHDANALDPKVIAWHGARCAFELALIDLLLRQEGLSLAELLPPKRDSVTYSGVITSSSQDTVARIAKHLKMFGLTEIKVKIGTEQDRPRLEIVRELLGADCSLRVDANGGLRADDALATLEDLADLRIDSAEQPIARGEASELASLRAASPIPIMVDESLVTLADARELIGVGACDFFNLRISKCGGIYGTLKMAELAANAGVQVQLGSQVGETAILSAAGRHVAAYLDHPKFVEGSFGTMLLAEDIAKELIQFGRGGKGSLLKSPGLGISVRVDVLNTFAHQIIHCL